jgi:TonB family protein
MLDQFTNVERARRRRRIGPAVSLSIAAHIAVVAALVAGGMWRIEKLTATDPPILLAAGIGAPLPDTGEPAPPKPRPPKRRHRTSEPRQPSEEPPPDDAADVDPGAGGDQDGPAGDPTGAGPGGCPPGATCPTEAAPPEPACGDHQVQAGEECDDGNTSAGDGCSPACRREPAEVGARIIEGYRVAGDPQIPAPEPVRSQMMRSGERRVIGTIRMCLGTDGAVRSLRVVRSTGYRDYDDRLTDRMRAWRYRPYRTAEGTPVPVCTAVTFIYDMR